MEEFLEECSYMEDDTKETKKYNTFFGLACACAGLAVIWFCVFLFYSVMQTGDKGVDGGMVLTWVLVYGLPVIALGVLAVVFAKRMFKTALEYDYTFVGGTLRISVINNRKRRREILHIECGKITKVGLFDSEEYKKNAGIENTKVHTSIAKNVVTDEKTIYYILFTNRDEREIYLIDCSKEFIKSVIRAGGIHVLDGSESRNVIFG